MSPRLSIVVPFYNVESYIVDCLESLSRQTMTDFEAILVDDGSGDASLELATAHCASDPRFRIVRQENQGLGPARNTGIAHAQGEFLTFVDSDDLVPARAYQQMVRSLEGSGSDMAAGDARRFNDLGVRDSYVHAVPFAQDRTATHVFDFPALALDRMAWNKVYRRRFWDEKGLAFPAIMYEDYPVTIRSHVLARSVDVLSSPVYYWREREGGELSITQRRWELANVRDRVASAEMVLDFLAAEAPQLLGPVEAHFLHIDVSAIAAAVHDNDESSHEELIDLALRLHNRTSAASRAALIPFERVQSNLLERRRVSELKVLEDRRAVLGTGAPIRAEGLVRKRYYLELPFLDDESVGVPRSAYEVPPSSVSLVASVRDAFWSDGRLELELRAGLQRLPLTERTKIEVWMEEVVAGGRGRKVRLDTERFPLGTWTSAHLAGLRVTIDPAALGRQGLPEPGFWKLMVSVRSGRIRRVRSVRDVATGRARWAGTVVLDGDLWAATDVINPGFGIAFGRPRTTVEKARADGGDVLIEGSYRADEFDAAPVVRCFVDDGSESREFLAEATRGVSDVHAFSARIPAADLITVLGNGSVEETAVWLVRLVVHGEPSALRVAPSVVTAGVALGDRTVSTETSLHNNLLLHDSFAHPVVDAVTWTDDGRLRVGGRHTRSEERPELARLRRYVTPALRLDVDLPLAWTGDRFEVVLDVQDLVARAADLSAENEGRQVTPWELLLPIAGGWETSRLDVHGPTPIAPPRTLEENRCRVLRGRGARFGVVIER